MTPELEAKIDALIAKYKAWQDSGLCYACGAPGTHRVTLTWMGNYGGKPGRIYCGIHAGEWASAGWPSHVHLIPNTLLDRLSADSSADSSDL